MCENKKGWTAYHENKISAKGPIQRDKCVDFMISLHPALEQSFSYWKEIILLFSSNVRKRNIFTFVNLHKAIGFWDFVDIKYFPGEIPVASGVSGLHHDFMWFPSC